GPHREEWRVRRECLGRRSSRPRPESISAKGCREQEPSRGPCAVRKKCGRSAAVSRERGGTNDATRAGATPVPLVRRRAHWFGGRGGRTERRWRYWHPYGGSQ